MSEHVETCMRALKEAIEAATGGCVADAEVIGLLKGEVPFDRPIAGVVLEHADLVGQLSHALGINSKQIYETYMIAVQIGGASSEEMAEHPEVVRRKVGPVWPPNKPFPLTPLEAWYVMRGWDVAPAAGVTMQQILEELPGKLEGGNGWVQLWEP
ncbi:MAG: hypothetical protein ACRYFY_01695 [Janthinobacterium lividum]